MLKKIDGEGGVTKYTYDANDNMIPVTAQTEPAQEQEMAELPPVEESPAQEMRE